jgi:hypothetical protein
MDSWMWRLATSLVNPRQRQKPATGRCWSRWAGSGPGTCCYAKSEKSWINDPQGVAWETFLTTGESTTYGGGGTDSAAPESHRATKPAECCIPAAETKAPEAPKASPCCGPRAMEQA